ncbi:MAG TPA: zinc-dependent metalloprotease family protein, partial [Candidatus Sulfotelmatobacter sp.]
MAIATTRGFTADTIYGGGGDGVAARNTTLMNVAQIVNMVNALYEPDVAVHFNLIGNELNAIFDTTSNPDPGYTDGDENALLGQNQQFLDTAVGNGNYDIGHVLGLTSPGSAAG